MLGEPGDPIILADGTKISPINGRQIKDSQARGGFVKVPSGSEAQAIVAKSRRAVAELPLPPKHMTAVGMVLMYSMWGLNDSDIAITVGLSEDQVLNIKKIPEYKTLSDDILKNVLEFEANDVRTFMKQNAARAAKKVVDMVEEEGALGLRAASDILDRAGFRPADVHEHTHKFEDTLKIEYIRKEEREDLPVINAEYREKI